MSLSTLDLSIILAYIVIVLAAGFYVSRRANQNLEAYFLGGKTIKWYVLGLSNASGMFDISGAMWTVSILFIYGLKSAFIPWLWPVWNQVFVFVYLALWMRRSGVMTGAEWITFRFGDGRGARLSHLIIVAFAVISVLGFMAYFFEGIGKFCVLVLPWDLALQVGLIDLSSANSYALLICGLTALYTIKGGMYSVVFTEVIQFVIMTVSCFAIGYIAYTSLTHEQVMAVVPAGWDELSFGWRLGLDWADTPYAAVNERIATDGFDLFGILLMLMVFKGIFASVAGPVPSYDMQRILAAGSPAEAAKMGFMTTAVLFIPRYLMVASFGALALVYLGPELAAMGSDIDFEQVLPLAIQKFLPTGLKGLLLAGLLAAFMGTFSAVVNSAPAYLVNDVYKKYVDPHAPQSRYIQLSIWSSLLLVVVGIGFGFYATSLNQLTLWITAALYGGYAAANALKWIWWRFNGYGYFYGMLFGLIASTVKLFVFPDYTDIYIFPIILACSVAGCIFGTYACPLGDRAAIKRFYRRTRPWGFWGPIRAEVMAENPNFVPNRDFGRDVVNILIGIVWQMAQVVIPIYFIIKDNGRMVLWSAVLVLTTALLKRLWWDRLEA
ncbi:sodium:solute symporter family protein [Neolewinella sp.]|uniref:sodium:solute symporter family protein n=1 Tax=Neolewinella sp. TaxID=2993543 RepID=UPI003B52C04E